MNTLTRDQPEDDKGMRNYEIVDSAVYESGSIVSYRRISWAHAWVRWICRKFASND